MDQETRRKNKRILLTSALAAAAVVGLTDGATRAEAQWSGCTSQGCYQGGGGNWCMDNGSGGKIYCVSDGTSCSQPGGGGCSTY